LGEFFERDWGENKGQSLFPKVLAQRGPVAAENSAGANRRLRVETDKVLTVPASRSKSAARAFDEKMEETKRYRLVARLSHVWFHPPPVPLQESVLTPRSTEAIYEGELLTPSLASSLSPRLTGRPRRAWRPSTWLPTRATKSQPNRRSMYSFGRSSRVSRPAA